MNEFISIFRFYLSWLLISTLIIFISIAQNSFGATTAPSQIVPDVLDEIEKREIENQKNNKETT